MDSVLRAKWFELSLVQQMVNIGNEVKRALRLPSETEQRNAFLDKAIQYTNLTMEDPKNFRVMPELRISREVLEDYRGGHFLDCTDGQIIGYYIAYQYLL